MADSTAVLLVQMKAFPEAGHLVVMMVVLMDVSWVESKADLKAD